MDQSCVAGIGNIYRAEILFKAGVHPEQPARTLPRAVFERVWAHSVLLLQRGFLTGSILTVDPEEARVLGPKWCAFDSTCIKGLEDCRSIGVDLVVVSP